MKRSVAVAIALVLLLSISAYAVWAANRSETEEWKSVLPPEACKMVEQYYAASKEDVARATEYVHFEDEFDRLAYIDSGDELLDYRVESVEKINDRLYELVFLYKSEQSVEMCGDEFQTAYNFVVNIDGEWKYVNGYRGIPEDLRENLDPEKYRYRGEDVIDDGVMPLEWEPEDAP